MRATLFVVAALVATATAFAVGPELSRSINDLSAIEAINNDPESTWVAGVNEVFEGMTLWDAKKMVSCSDGVCVADGFGCRCRYWFLFIILHENINQKYLVRVGVQL